MISKIKEAAPSWVDNIREDADELQIRAQPCLPGGKEGQTYDLHIKIRDNILQVFELNPGKILPKSCPERHINFDGTFCIGLDAGKNINTDADVKRWWQLLEEFLQCQYVAKKRGVWPSGKWLSHGSAAHSQIEMEKIAETLGWQDEIGEAIELKKGWLAGDLPRHRKNSGMLCNQRLSCPRGCTKKGKVIARRRCIHRQAISELVFHERQRREREKDFINSYKKDGFVCCGTMKQCPFRDLDKKGESNNG